MWPKKQIEKDRLKAALQHHSANVRNLPGIGSPPALEALSMQLVASLRREDYYRKVQHRAIAAPRADPNSGLFDAERAVAFHMQNGNVEEAAWLVFLMTHFARPADTGWLRLRDVYGELGQGVWSWPRVKQNPAAFIQWLSANWTNVRGKFGNHRKYESLRPTSNRNIGRVLNSYLQLIGNSHGNFFAQAVQNAGNNPETIFDYLYRRMDEVVTFGRLAKFDYLALIGRYGIAPILPGIAYLSGATGPTRGVRLLFLGTSPSSSPVATLQTWLTDLDQNLSVGMIVMEDALCNWQKSPAKFIHFTG